MGISRQRKKLMKQIDKNQPRELNAQEIAICFKIIAFIGRKIVSMNDIANYLSITEREVRKYISLIRKEMNKFQNPTGTFFIIATKKGYKLTDKQEDLEMYLGALTKKYNNLLSQIMQIKLSLLNKKEYNNEL